MRMTKRLYVFINFIFLFSIATLWGQQKATPKIGEGIAAFLLRHNRSPQKYYDDFVELNKKKLGKGNVLKMGVTYVIPPVKCVETSSSFSKENSKNGSRQDIKANTIIEPLFGKRQSKVRVKSRRLEGACFYVVSGHGGPDPGAIGKSGRHELHEDEYAYDIALRLARNLMQEGAKVYIIIQDAKDGIRNDAYLSNSKKETCMGDPIPLNQVQRLQQRCDKINSLYQKDRHRYQYCRSIFIHVDSRGRGKQTDVFFYHSGQTEESRRLAINMKNMFETKYDKHQPNRGFSGTVSSRNLYVLSHSIPSAVFVELGNIQNAFDQRRLVISSNRQALAKWLMEGFIIDYQSKK